MKKLVSLLLVLLLCVSVLAASLQTVGRTAEADPAPASTVTAPARDPDPINTFPGNDNHEVIE